MSAEPLRASWQPTREQGARQRSAKHASPRRRRAHRWRLVALPVLLVLTALVIIDSTRGSAEGDDGSLLPGATSNAAEGSDDEPVVRENPPERLDLDIPTAKLPPGGDYTKDGKGTWHVVPGQGEKVGDGGRLYTYTIDVEDGIDPASYAGDESFARAVESTLSDPRSWIWDGAVSFQRVDESDPNPDFRVSLTSPGTVRKPEICGGVIPYETSCRRDVGAENRVVINLARWVRGAKAFGGDMTGYRQYVVNHEVGHALGLGHEGCPEDGELAPVMMQQTFGVANDYVAQLNDTEGGDQGAVPADGKTCKPNAWPDPQPAS